MSERGRGKALNIEQVFTQLSRARVHGGPAGRPPRVVLSPRSAEACLREGVDPEELKIRDIDSFWEPNLDPAAQRMRHEAYSTRRHEKMKLVCWCADLLVAGDGGWRRRRRRRR
jgi:hypothetical protein